MITVWVPKFRPVRVCGPWDGTDESAAEFNEFGVRGPTDGGNAFIPQSGGAPNRGPARLWSRFDCTWVTVPRGYYVVDASNSNYVVLSKRELREFYQPAETEGVAVPKAPTT